MTIFRNHPTPGSGHRAAFTLIELLVALAIMAGVMAVIVATFVTTLRGWQRGGELLEHMHHGDFVMEQLVSALRLAAFFQNAPEKYGFWLEDEQEGRYPGDVLSWVTSGTALIPNHSYLANGLHRIEVSIGEDPDGNPAFAVSAYPHLANPEDLEVEPWIISSLVQGLDCRVYNVDDEQWEDEWEDTNAVPSLIEIALYLKPEDEFGDPLVIRRAVEIPVAPVVSQAVVFRQEDQDVDDAQSMAGQDVRGATPVATSPTPVRRGTTGTAGQSGRTAPPMAGRVPDER